MSAARPLPQVLSFGEALTDLIRSGPQSWTSLCGGSPWNVASALAALGLPSAFGGAISSCVFGQALWQASEAAGLDLRFLQQQPATRPPLLAIVHELNPPQYFFIGEGAADLFFEPAALPKGWREALRWAHFGGISLAREPLAGRLLALAAELKAQGVRISYDPNFRLLMDSRYDATLERMSRLADVIKVSDEDLQGLFRCSDPQQGLAQLREWNPQALLLLTQGAAGARLYHPGGDCSARPPPIELVDSVGAGDASMAGLLFSLLTQPAAGPQTHLRWAMAAGAAACEVAGAARPSLARLRALAEPGS